MTTNTKNCIMNFCSKQKQRVIEFFLVFSIILLCIIHALPAKQNADFWPINGDFQNYNPVRRFLNGQIPFRDFSVYLGCGHLYFGSAATFIFGAGSPNFATSKMAFNFLAIFSFCAICYCLFRFVMKNQKRTIPLFLTNAIALFVFINPLLFSQFLSIDLNFYNNIRASLSTGNSARFLRGAAPAVFVGLFLLAKKLISKIPLCKKHPHFIEPISLGVSSGMIIFYSNDYGFATAICVFAIYFFKTAFSKQSKEIRCKTFGIFFLSLAICFFATGELITLGKIGSYISKTFGVGNAQALYYGIGGKKPCYIFEIDSTFYELCQGLVALCYFIIFVRDERRKINLRLFVPLLMNCAAFAAANEYKLLSGGLLHEVSFSILYITIVAEVSAAMLSLAQKIEWKNKISKTNAACIFLLGVNLAYIASEIPKAFKNNGGGTN